MNIALRLLSSTTLFTQGSILLEMLPDRARPFSTMASMSAQPNSTLVAVRASAFGRLASVTDPFTWFSSVSMPDFRSLSTPIRFTRPSPMHLASLRCNDNSAPGPLLDCCCLTMEALIARDAPASSSVLAPAQALAARDSRPPTAALSKPVLAVPRSLAGWVLRAYRGLPNRAAGRREPDVPTRFGGL